MPVGCRRFKLDSSFGAVDFKICYGVSMRVVHLISNLELGGAERTLVRLVGSLSNCGVEQSVVSMIPGGALATDVKRTGADLVELGADRSIFSGRLLPEVGQVLRYLQPDLVQGWMYHANLAASVTGMLGYHKAPVFWGVRQSLARLADNRLSTVAVILAGSALRMQPAGVIYNSRRAAAEHERWGYPKSRRNIIFNGVDVDLFKPDPAARAGLMARLDLDEDSLVIGRVARNHPMKDNKTLFAAFAMVADSLPKARLVLIGPGMEAADKTLQQLAASTGAPGRVHFLGSDDHPERTVPAFDLSVLSSSSEGFPNVVAEAMACGVPVVATDVGESAHIIDDPSRVVPARSPVALADAMMRILTLPIELRNRLAGDDRKRILSAFSLQQMGARQMNIWREHSGISIPVSRQPSGSA